MEKQEEMHLSKMIDDIKDMRKMMEAGSHAFRYIYMAKNIRLLFLLGGLCVLIFTLAYHILLIIFDSHALIPGAVKLMYFSLMILSCICLVVLRTRLTLAAGRKLDENMTLWGLTKLIMSHPLWIAVIPVMAVFCSLPFKMAHYWPGSYFVYYSAVAYGVILNMIGVGIRSMEYSIAGYWAIITGLIGLFLIIMPIHVAIAFNFAPAFLLFALISYAKGRRD